MFYTKLEQRAVTKAFDTILEYTNDTFADPVVAAKLGANAIELQRICNYAFVPNLENGTFVIPREQKGSDNLAIVPLTSKQATNAYAVTAPLNTEAPVRTWSSEQAAVSTRYGLDLPEELDALFQEGPPGDVNAPTLRGLRSATLARTAARLSRTSDGVCQVSRPNLMIRRSLLKGKPSECSAVIAHETIHVSDLLEDGALYGTLTYSAATELRAYHVGATIYKAANLNSSAARDSIRLDALREKEIGHTDKPFTSNPFLMDVLKRKGKI